MADITKVFIEMHLPGNTAQWTTPLAIRPLPKNSDIAYDFGSAMPILHVIDAINVINVVLNDKHKVIMSTNIHDGIATLNYAQNAVSGEKVNVNDLAAGSILSICLEYNTSWSMK